MKSAFPALSRRECGKSSQDEPSDWICRRASGPVSQGHRPLSHHPTHSSYCTALLPKEASKDICFSCPLRECNDHLPHTSDPLGTSMSHHLVCVVFHCEGGWHDLGTHGVLGCFSFGTCNPENQTLSPGTIMPLGDPAQVVKSSLVYTAILILYSVKCPKQQENQHYMSSPCPDRATLAEHSKAEILSNCPPFFPFSIPGPLGPFTLSLHPHIHTYLSSSRSTGSTQFPLSPLNC